PGRSTRRNSERPRAGSEKNISPRLQTTASKVSSENERACASSTKTEALERFAEALACLLGHGGGDIGGPNVTRRAARGAGRPRRGHPGRGPPARNAPSTAKIPEREARGLGPPHPARPRGKKPPPAAGRRLPDSTPAEIAAHDRADRLPSLAVEALHSHLLDR